MAPELISAAPMPEIFMVALHTYLLSGIPVVLGLKSKDGDGHAVTAAGFMSGTEPDPLLETTVKVRSQFIKKLYVHDDRLGPYARAELLVTPGTRRCPQMLMVKIDWPNRDPEMWRIVSAVAPLYPKMRLPVRSLIQLAEIMASTIERIVQGRANELNVEFAFERSGEYLARLAGRIDGAGAKFLRKVVFSRWCAVIRWHLADKRIVEFVFDTTDILRDEATLGRELLSAVVCLEPTLAPDFRQLADELSVPFLPD
jgi:hypothetical protein